MILLVSNSRDFATDYVVAELLNRGLSYRRLDLDLLHQDRVFLDPLRRRLVVELEGQQYSLDNEQITAILYRAPTHLRESSGGRYEPPEALARHQWAAFARSLALFDRAKWVNHPCATYLAENKPFQLATAMRVGFEVPVTVVANALPVLNDPVWNTSERVALKALDSFLLRLPTNEDAFFYTQAVTFNDLAASNLASMPVVMQQYFSPKLDIRVTVIGTNCYAVSVLVDGDCIEGDWRLAKERATFSLHNLPAAVRSCCLALVQQLGLVFGAIDLVLVHGRYYFLEINPTGEWAWLVDALHLPIDGALADALSV